MLPGASACGVCGERDHKSSHCPCLHSPLTPGFYSGGGGGGGHSHDEDDESLQIHQRLFNSVNRRTKHCRKSVTQPNARIHNSSYLP